MFRSEELTEEKWVRLLRLCDQSMSAIALFRHIGMAKQVAISLSSPSNLGSFIFNSSSFYFADRG
jgi:hypothetical protein